MSIKNLTADTEVVLLLCGRFGGETQEGHQPLKPREYRKLADWLIDRNLRPSGLLSDAGQSVLATVEETGLERKHVEFLLGRGTALALALERWSRGGLWVISRGDAEYPKRLKRQLKRAAPPLLYGAGEKSLLELGGLAIIGSRHASESALHYTRVIASKCAKEGIAVLSGGARGVDSAAMQGATEAGGFCIGVLASDLLKASVNRQNRMGLEEGRLVLVSPYFPEAGFNAGNAMGRNRYIYTLADQALVVDSALESGGTWEGAVENQQHGWVPLYVRTPGEGPGNAALVARGALPFTLAADSAEALADVFGAQVVADERTGAGPSEQQLLLAEVAEAATETAGSVSLVAAEPVQLARPATESTATPLQAAVVAQTAEVLFPAGSADVVGVTEGLEAAEHSAPPQAKRSLDMFADFGAKLATLLAGGPLTEGEISDLLCIEKGQTKAWLKRAVEARLVQKERKPPRYALCAGLPIQMSLKEGEQEKE